MFYPGDLKGMLKIHMLNEKCMFVMIDFVTFHQVAHIWDKTNRHKLLGVQKEKVLRQYSGYYLPEHTINPHVTVDPCRPHSQQLKFNLVIT